MDNIKHHYVYKYVHDSTIVYIGRCDNRPVEKRIMEHRKEEKFVNYCKENGFQYNEFEIYFTAFPSFVEEKIAETILINQYKPVLNSADKVETDYTCIDAEIKQDWKKFNFNNNAIKSAKPKVEYGQRLIRSMQGEKELLDMIWSTQDIVDLIKYLYSVSDDDKRMVLPAEEVPRDKNGYYAPFLLHQIQYSIPHKCVGASVIVSYYSDDYVKFVYPLCDCKKFIPLLEKQYIDLKKKIYNFKGYKEKYPYKKHFWLERFFSKRDSGEWNESNMFCAIESHGDITEGLNVLFGERCGF